MYFSKEGEWFIFSQNQILQYRPRRLFTGPDVVRNCDKAEHIFGEFPLAIFDSEDRRDPAETSGT